MWILTILCSLRKGLFFSQYKINNNFYCYVYCFRFVLSCVSELDVVSTVIQAIPHSVSQPFVKSLLKHLLHCMIERMDHVDQEMIMKVIQGVELSTTTASEVLRYV